MEAWRVHKFGGSSVADAACMERVARILEDDPLPRVAAVLSACRGVTDALLALVNAAERREDGDAERLEAIRQRHVGIADTLLAARRGRRLRRGAHRRLPRHRRHPADRPADSRRVAGRPRPRRRLRRDLVDAPVRALPAGARPAAGGVRWIDAREIVEVDPAPLGPSVLWPESRANADRLIPARCRAPRSIITGFIARTREGLQTTLGRNGSDFSGIDLRRAARRRGDRHLDRRRRRAERRSAPRARRDGHRLALVQRGDGAGVLRREGDPSADDGAGGEPGDPDLDPQHVRAGEGRARSSAPSRCRRTRSRASPASTASR